MAQRVVQPDAAQALRATAPRASVLQWLLKFARHRPLGAAAGSLAIFFLLAAVFADLVAPFGSSEREGAPILGSPSLSHLFGTDNLGRDTLSRVIYGARLSLFIAMMVTLLSSIAGIAIGVVSAFYGGRTDKISVMLIDASMAFPSLILAIALVAALGQSVPNVIIALLLPFSARFARIVRATALTVRAMPYVEAGRSVGASNLRLIRLYILPNVMATIIVLASLNFAVALLVEGSLSFLGLGPPPPAPSWGRMLAAEGQQYFKSAPWLALAPGAVLATAVLAFNLLGDTLRDELDPRLRGTRR